jgi:hypothetical protein
MKEESSSLRITAYFNTQPLQSNVVGLDIGLAAWGYLVTIGSLKLSEKTYPELDELV